MLIINKTLINVEQGIEEGNMLMTVRNHPVPVGRYEVVYKGIGFESIKYVDLKKTNWAQSKRFLVKSLLSALKRGVASLWYPIEQADKANTANIINDDGGDWIEESVNSDSKDYDDDIKINGKRYVRVPSSYINNEDDLSSFLKDNNAYIANKNMELYHYCSMTRVDWDDYRLNLNYKDVTSGKERDGYILLSSLLSILKSQQFALYISESVAKEVGLLSDENIPSGEEFNESLYETSNHKYSDEPGDGIIEYKGSKYYKVDAEKHIHKQSDLMKYLVKGLTIFKVIQAVKN